MNKIRALYELFYIAIQMIYALFVAVPLAIILFIITWLFEKLKETVKKLSLLYLYILFKTKSRFNLYRRRKVDKRVKNSFTISK